MKHAADIFMHMLPERNAAHLHFWKAAIFLTGMFSLSLSVSVCFVYRNVVLGVPVVSILISVRSQCCGSADVCDAAAS